MKHVVSLALVLSSVLVSRPTAARSDEPEKVIRLGMIGLDTSHVIAFPRYLNDPKNNTGCRIPGRIARLPCVGQPRKGVHMANASYRAGAVHSADEVRDAIKDRGSEAVEAPGRFQEHLAANGVDFSQSKMTLGPWLEMDSQREEFVGAGEAISPANQLLRGNYRKPLVIPEHV